MNKIYKEFVNELSLEEMAQIGEPKLKAIYNNALIMRKSAQEDKLYELQLPDCDFNLVEELQDEVDMYDELLIRIETILKNN